MESHHAKKTFTLSLFNCSQFAGSACSDAKKPPSKTKSPATTLAPGENGRFWHQSASASRCGGSWLENLPFCHYTWLPVDRFSSQARGV